MPWLQVETTTGDWDRPLLLAPPPPDAANRGETTALARALCLRKVRRLGMDGNDVGYRKRGVGTSKSNHQRPRNATGQWDPEGRLDLTTSRPFLLTALSFFVFPVS